MRIQGSFVYFRFAILEGRNSLKYTKGEKNTNISWIIIKNSI